MNFTVSRVVNACIASIFLTEYEHAVLIAVCCITSFIVYQMTHQARLLWGLNGIFLFSLHIHYFMWRVHSHPSLTHTEKCDSPNEWGVDYAPEQTHKDTCKQRYKNRRHTWPRNPLTTGFHQKAQIRHKTCNLPNLLPFTCRSFLPTMRMNTFWGFCCCVKNSLLISETTI